MTGREREEPGPRCERILNAELFGPVSVKIREIGERRAGESSFRSQERSRLENG